MTDTNWVTGEAILWLDNDEASYHESRRIVKEAMRHNVRDPKYTADLKRTLRDAVPNDEFSVIQQFDDIDWHAVIDHLIDDIKEGYE